MRSHIHNLTQFLLILSLCFFFSPFSVQSQDRYVPPAGTEWMERPPSDLGLNEELIRQARQMALDNENSVNRDLRIAILEAFSREPYHDLAGPVRERGGPAGMIIKDGYIAAQWGDLHRVDMTFSVTKSYLTTVAGLAWDRGLIRSVHDPLTDYVWDRTFDGAHNSSITWHHLLNQSSDWYGTLFGMEDWGDRPPREGGIDEWRMRELREPGTHYEYNDVRVNLLAYSLLQVLREPLPKILRDEIMNPIGATPAWRWYGYDNSYVMVDGVEVQSVSGGGHHGGGLFISTMDQARFGLLFARDGNWNGNQLISSEWIEMAPAPSDPNPSYGYMWWTLKGDTDWGDVPDHIYYAAGFGGNYIIVDNQNDLVIVTRWLDGGVLGEFVESVYKAME
ncbi:MAG: serine hydrolase [Balneolaceae bacterium]|nr:serine hydrolase [Balneolaceae bacterium]